MSMTFLQRVARLALECGVVTPPSTVVGQTGESNRLVSWLATADEDVQRKHNEWKFMVGSFTINTVIGNGSYAGSDCVVPVTNLRDWRKDSFKCYLSSSGVATEMPFYFIDYQEWYDIYNTGTQNNGAPVHFTIGNDMSILIGPKPNAVYVISGEYQKSVTTMVADADLPAYPSEYHMLAVYGAMMMYGSFEAASEVYQSGEKRYKAMLAEMRRTQLPRVKFGRPLA